MKVGDTEDEIARLRALVDEYIARLRALVDEYKRDGKIDDLVDVLYKLTLAFYMKGDIDSASDMIENTIAKAETLENDHRLIRSLQLGAHIAVMRNDYALAIHRFECAFKKRTAKRYRLSLVEDNMFGVVLCHLVCWRVNTARGLLTCYVFNVPFCNAELSYKTACDLITSVENDNVEDCISTVQKYLDNAPNKIWMTKMFDEIITAALVKRLSMIVL